jgi:hypothetical protein
MFTFREFLLENDNKDSFEDLQEGEEIYLEAPSLRIKGVCEVKKLLFRKDMMIVIYEGKNRAVTKNWVKNLQRGKGVISAKKTGIA